MRQYKKIFIKITAIIIFQAFFAASMAYPEPAALRPPLLFGVNKNGAKSKITLTVRDKKGRASDVYDKRIIVGVEYVGKEINFIPVEGLDFESGYYIVCESEKIVYRKSASDKLVYLTLVVHDKKGRITDIYGNRFAIGKKYIGKKIRFESLEGMDFESGYYIVCEGETILKVPLDENGEAIGLIRHDVVHKTRLPNMRHVSPVGVFSYNGKIYNLTTEYANKDIEIVPRIQKGLEVSFTAFWKGKRIGFFYTATLKSFIKSKAGRSKKTRRSI